MLLASPGGMEKPTDTHKQTHAVVLKPRDTTFGGSVSRLQIAELVTTLCANPELAANKVCGVLLKLLYSQNAGCSFVG